MHFRITSPNFNFGDLLDDRFTCDGADLSPHLVWSHSPTNTQSFALIMDDPDAPMGCWDHWILYNIPATICELQEGISELPEGTMEGLNSWEKTGYGGPCPPDRIHRYYFKLYALDTVLKFDQTPTKQQIEHAIEKHIIGKTELMATYDLKKRR
jgi:Raf kinase inhibitor-like YbhB/YbcL family protein